MHTSDSSDSTQMQAESQTTGVVVPHTIDNAQRIHSQAKTESMRDTDAENLRASPYHHLYEIDGYDSGLTEPVKNYLLIDTPNGYGVIQIDALCNFFNARPQDILPVCYSLFLSGELCRLLVRDDHIIYAVKLVLCDEVLAIQGQGSHDWLKGHSGAGTAA